MTPQAQKEAIELVEEMEAAQIKYKLTDEQMYEVATEESRKEYFVKMYKILKELTE